MAANKGKQNLRYQKVCKRVDKKIRYDGFTKDEIKYIKTKQKYNQIQKDLNSFWSTAPRKENNSVNWECMSEEELDYFEYIHKISEKLLKALSKLEEKINVQRTEYIFMQLNCNSVSY